MKNTGYLYAKMGIQVFLSLYTTRLILDALGATDFGIYGIVASFISLLSVFQMAMASSTQRFISFAEGEKNDGHKCVVFSSSLFLHLGIAVIILLILELSSLFLFDGIFNIPNNRIAAAKFIYQCAIFSIFISVLVSPYEGLINAHENMLYFSIVGVMESFFKFVIALMVSMYAGDKLCLYGLLMALISLVVAVILCSYCNRKYSEAKTISLKNVEYSTIKRMAAFAGWGGVGTISWVIFHQGNAIILNHFFGTIYNAAHSLAYQLSGQIGALGNTALKALNPVIVKDAGARDYQGMYNATRMGNSISFFLISLCNLPVLVHLEALLYWWLKEVPICTELFIYLYFSAVLIESLAPCLIVAIQGVGNIKAFQLLCTVCNILAPVVIIFLLMANFQPYIIYCLMIISSAFKLLIRIFYARKVCGFPLGEMIMDTIRSVVLFIIGMILALLLKNVIGDNRLLLVFTNIVLDVVIYILLFCIIGMTGNDRKYIFAIISERARIIRL
jgi:Na+-driven multidrug efflux pump